MGTNQNKSCRGCKIFCQVLLNFQSLYFFLYFNDQSKKIMQYFSAPHNF